MTTSIIIIICVLLLLAYVFDISASKTKIPSIILLLVLGYGMKQASIVLNISIPDLSPILPILGTVGLILIVLEGSLELELNKKQMPFVGKTSLIALMQLLAVSFGLAYAFYSFSDINFKVALANAIPFAIISSAIAIPSAKNLIKKNKEFITYESSLSDIFGVIFFNFITQNDNIGGQSFGNFAIEILLIILVSIVSTIVLAFLLSKIKHHVKFTPIILMVVLIYAVSKTFHLPALIFILLFGVVLGNIDEFKDNKFIQKLKPDTLKREVHKFKEISTEIAFLVRALFFLLMGYLIEASELLNTDTMLWAIDISAGIFIIRYIILKLFKMDMNPILYIAPRGLITILLFLSIPLNQVCTLANKSLIIQVIILSALFMMLGMMGNTSPKLANTDEEKH